MYHIDHLFFEGMKTHKRREDDRGTIIIGGDKCDLHCTSAFGSNSGVDLTDIEVKTSTPDLTPDEVENLAIDTVKACYASIQEDTFLKTKR